MANKDLVDGMAVFASSYVKRFLETHYDALMRSAPARKLMEQGAPKLLIGALLARLMNSD